jgi:CRP/FNR family transcriptional regulator
MIEENQYERIAQTLPFLRRAEPQARRDFLDNAYLARIPAGHDVFVEGDQAEAIALLLSGVVRVYKIGENGREITLYRFGNGESCILTANVILSRQTFPAIATVERDAEAVMIPAGAFRQWIGRYDLWRDFIFGLLSQRLASVIATVDEVAFRRMDVRVAAFLLARSQDGGQVHITHQQIAAELGSSREVISRLLESLEEGGLIRRSRGVIEVLDVKGLATLAAM